MAPQGQWTNIRNHKRECPRRATRRRVDQKKLFALAYQNCLFLSTLLLTQLVRLSVCPPVRLSVSPFLRLSVPFLREALAPKNLFRARAYRIHVSMFTMSICSSVCQVRSVGRASREQSASASPSAAMGSGHKQICFAQPLISTKRTTTKKQNLKLRLVNCVWTLTTRMRFLFPHARYRTLTAHALGERTHTKQTNMNNQARNRYGCETAVIRHNKLRSIPICVMFCRRAKQNQIWCFLSWVFHRNGDQNMSLSRKNQISC